VLQPAARIAIQESAVFPTRLGWLAIAGTHGVLRDVRFGQAHRSLALAAIAARGIVRLTEDWQWLVERLTAYAAGEMDDFSDVRLDLAWATPFARRVLNACRQISYGQTQSYAGLAARAGSPRAARAVGNAMKANRCPLVVPCHRVVHAGGGIGGFSAPQGAAMKERLLHLERQATLTLALEPVV